MHRAARAFRAALTARNVLVRYISAMEQTAMEFPTEDALKKYLDKHPGADKSKHHVKKDEPSKPDDGEKLPKDIIDMMSHGLEGLAKGLSEDNHSKLTRADIKNEVIPNIEKMLSGETPLPKGQSKEHVEEVLKRLREHIGEGAKGKPSKAPKLDALKELVQGPDDSLSKLVQGLEEGKPVDLDEARKARVRIEDIFDGPALDKDTEKKLRKALDQLNDAVEQAHQASPEYKTEKNGDYYPQKKPKGWVEAEEAKKIKDKQSPEQRAWAEAMPDADLDKNVAYDHPAIKRVSDAIYKKLKSGEMSQAEFNQEFEKIEDLRDELHEAARSAKNDKEADSFRFPKRQLYKLWQGYNGAMQKLQYGDETKPKKPHAPKKPKPTAPPTVSEPKLPDHVIDREVSDPDTYHKDPEYKTKRNRAYYPTKAPPGATTPKEIDEKLSPEQKSWYDTMAEEDLDTDKSYAHPALKKVKKTLIDRIKSGKMSPDELAKQMSDLERFKLDISYKYTDAKNDADADHYRFPMRKVYHLWQAYNDAIQSDEVRKAREAEKAGKAKLTDEDTSALRKFKKERKSDLAKGMSPAEAKQEFMQHASPETRERVKKMTPQEFQAMVAALNADEE